MSEKVCRCDGWLTEMECRSMVASLSQTHVEPFKSMDFKRALDSDNGFPMDYIVRKLSPRGERTHY